MGSDTSKSKKRATQLTEEEIQLLLKNTHFNRQQIKEWHQGFLVSRRCSLSACSIRSPIDMRPSDRGQFIDARLLSAIRFACFFRADRREKTHRQSQLVVDGYW